MSLRFALFLLWTTLIFCGCLGASYNAWSPYSDEERPAGRGGGGVRGPTHK